MSCLIYHVLYFICTNQIKSNRPISRTRGTTWSTLSSGKHEFERAFIQRAYMYECIGGAKRHPIYSRTHAFQNAAASPYGCQNGPQPQLVHVAPPAL